MGRFCSVPTAAVLLAAIAGWPSLAFAQPRHPGVGKPSPRHAVGPKHPSSGPKVTGRTPANLKRLEDMSPQERQHFLEKLPPDRRQKVEDQLERYRSLSPEQKAKLEDQYERFQHLPPARQEEIRKAYSMYTNLPPHRQRAVREELQRQRGMTDEERESRVSSEEFRNKFDKHEQKILEDIGPGITPEDDEEF